MIAAVEPSPSLLYALGGVFAILVIASIVPAVLRRWRPRGDYTELSRRVRTWWIMACVFALALVVGRVASLVLFGFLSFLALKEYLSLIPTRRADRRVLFWAYLAIPIQYVWVGMEWYGMFIIFIPVYVFLFLPMRMMLSGETKGFLRATGTLHWGLMTMVFSLSHAAYLLALPGEKNPNGGGAALLLFLVFLTEFNDVAQYVWGKLFGRRKVVPSISPGKTWAGLVGGVLTTTALATLLGGLLTPLTRVQSVGAGLIIGLAGFAGDVVVSSLKRDLGIKDSGTMLPGHGGILDRIDSLSYAAPLFFHYLYYLHY